MSPARTIRQAQAFMRAKKVQCQVMVQCLHQPQSSRRGVQVCSAPCSSNLGLGFIPQATIAALPPDAASDVAKSEEFLWASSLI